jgi:hypothetical protein
MTVKELIGLLQQYPENTNITIKKFVVEGDFDVCCDMGTVKDFSLTTDDFHFSKISLEINPNILV